MTKSNVFFISILNAIFFMVTFFSPIYEAKVAILTLLYFLIFICFCIIRPPSVLYYCFVFTIGFLYPLALIISNNETSIFEFIYQYISLISLLLIGKYLYENLETLHRISKINVIGYLLFLFITLLHSFIIGERYYIYANDIFVGQSRNVVSYYAIFSASLLLVSSKLNAVKVELSFLAILCFFCILLFGRSGIAISLSVLLIGYYYNNGFSFKMFLFTSLMFFCFMFYLPDILFILEATNFSRGLESPRSMITTEFFNQLTLKTIFVGVPIDLLPTVLSLEGNPHNSLFSVNLKFGFMVIWYMTTFLVVIFYLLFKDYILCALLLVLLVRVSLDTVAFFGQFTDVIFFILLFHSLQLFRKKN